MSARMLAFACDAAVVSNLRLQRIAAGGPAGKAEAKLMVVEKVVAFGRVVNAVLTGRYGSTVGGVTKEVAAFYAGAVRANRHRLSAARDRQRVSQARARR